MPIFSCKVIVKKFHITTDSLPSEILLWVDANIFFWSLFVIIWVETKNYKEFGSCDVNHFCSFHRITWEVWKKILQAPKYQDIDFLCCQMLNSFLKWLSTIFCILRRTHSQISQVIREYRKTAYRVPMAVLVCLLIPCQFMFYKFLGIVQWELC